jgi:hypothetical protein
MGMKFILLRINLILHSSLSPHQQNFWDGSRNGAIYCKVLKRFIKQSNFKNNCHHVNKVMIWQLDDIKICLFSVVIDSSQISVIRQIKSGGTNAFYNAI